MFGVVAYIGECLGVAGAITFIYVMTRSLKSRDEVKSWRVFINLAIIALILPYSAVEAVTKVVGKKLEPVVRETVDGTDFAGDFGYFKVVYYTGKTAKVVAVGTEKENWGGTNTAVIAINLTKKDSGWVADSYRWVNSDSRNKDGFTFPPYW